MQSCDTASEMLWKESSPMVWHKQMCMCRLTDKFLCIMLYWLDFPLPRQPKFILKLTKVCIQITQKAHIRLNR